MAVPGWQLRNVTEGFIEDALLNVHVKDTFERFSREATVWIADPDGSKRNSYLDFTECMLRVGPPRRHAHTLASDPDNGETHTLLTDGGHTLLSSPTAENRFGGFVRNPHEEAGVLRLDLLSHDTWLRKRDIFYTANQQGIEDTLQDLVTRFTPLVWNPNLVDVQNDRTIDRSWKGERLVTVIEELATKSDGEEFGATDDREFFFRPREAQDSPVSFTPDRWDDYDIDGDAGREVTRVTIYYGQSGENAVTVQNRERQLELQERLGADRPVIQEKTKSFPEIETEEAAEEKGHSILDRRDAIKVLELETWDAHGVRPGDVAPVVIPEKNVDDEFRVAEIVYRWIEDDTLVTLARNAEGVVDLLVELSEDLTRIDLRAGSDEATITEMLEFEVYQENSVKVEVLERSIPDDQFQWGEHKGGWGDPAGGPGGRWGDNMGAWTQHTEV
ncbi:hypothetical protein BRD56_05465 [Thermoplasmatales archaeon SW_10_69_26]|nr:MAG: hypothetical protein BRD56_05465 [Thermoplasmatales archaeon SW_10_69_26]